MAAKGYDNDQQRQLHVIAHGDTGGMPVQVHLIISGRVQGIGFRHYCVQVARQYGVHGWVKNRDDGCVEVMAEGVETSLEPFVGWCRRGPPAASVRDCRESYAKLTGEFDVFEVAF